MDEFPPIRNRALDLLKGDYFRDQLADDRFFSEAEDDTKVKAELFHGNKTPINEILCHCGLFGGTGSGKTMSLARFIEEYAIKRIPFTCWDIESGSFFTIPRLFPAVQYIELDPIIKLEYYEQILADPKEYKDFMTQKEVDFFKIPDAQNSLKKMRDQAKENYLQGRRTIFSFDKIPDARMRGAIAYSYSKEMWRLASEYYQEQKQLLHLTIWDEAQWAMPFPMAEVERTIYTGRLSDLIQEYATKGRKRWLPLLIASQRLAQLSAMVRAQLQNVFLMRASSLDKYYYTLFMKTMTYQDKERLFLQAMQFRPGEAFFVQNGRVSPALKFLKRRSVHPDESAKFNKAMKRAKEVHYGY